ncbi:MAG: T9SS type A sorting domain-containing protein, partial [Candidatus Latescibacteria bacterium]|nr:T9SS type A sorting domain-containing protein [Candidatus Latescibacterota bacterium]
EGVHSGNVSGEGAKIVVEVFAKGVTTALIGVKIEFDFKAEELKLDKVENSAFLFAIPEATGVNFAATAPVTLPESGFIGRAEFSTVADLTDKEFHLGIKSVTLAESAASSDVIAPEMMAMMSTISFNVKPRLEADETVIPVPPGSMGSATVTAINFAADATIAFEVQGEMLDNVMSAPDGAVLTLTASGPAKVTVTASDGMATTDPVTIEFVEQRIPALDAVVGMDMMNMMDDGMLAAGAGANEEIAIEVFAGDVDGIEPAEAAMIIQGTEVIDGETMYKGFTPAEGMTVLGISGNQVDIGAEEAVMLSNGGFLGTLKLMTGAEAVPFRGVLASGEETMLMNPAPVMYNFGPRLEVSAHIATIPRGGEATIKITALGFAEGAKITFSHEVDGAAMVDGHPEMDMQNVYTLTATGLGSAVVKVTASDGMASEEVTVQFDEQVPIELSSFVGSVIENRVVLNWATASQTNNAGFRVLRSTDGVTYEVVSALIAGAGTTDQLMDYVFEDASLPAVEKVYYLLEQIDLDGTINRSNPIEVLLGARFILPTEFASAVYPNPFNPRTTISYELPADTDVSVIIYDAIGQEIRQLVSRHYTAGRYSVQWDAKDHMGRSVGSGVYIAKIVAGSNTSIQKMLLLK